MSTGAHLMLDTHLLYVTIRNSCGMKKRIIRDRKEIQAVKFFLY